jgi:hypothetical protein
VKELVQKSASGLTCEANPDPELSQPEKILHPTPAHCSYDFGFSTVDHLHYILFNGLFFHQENGEMAELVMAPG